MPNIRLQSADGEFFDDHVEIVKCSGTIRAMLEECDTEDSDETVVTLLEMNSAVLNKIIQWANYHKEDAQSPEDAPNQAKRTDDISSWDAELLNVDQDTLLQLISAAYFLGIKGLLEVASKTLANMMRGKTPVQIRETFNIPNDFTPDEEEEVRNENMWCEKK